jgi:hypothetical protein
MQSRVDEDALRLRLDQVSGNRKADLNVGIFTLTPHGGGGGDPADVEHLDPHVALLAGCVRWKSVHMLLDRLAERQALELGHVAAVT